MKSDTYQLNWKRGHKAKSGNKKRTKQFTATTGTRFLKVYETRSGWVGRIQSRAVAYVSWSSSRLFDVPDPYETKVVGPCVDSRQARIALEVLLSLEEKL